MRRLVVYLVVTGLLVLATGAIAAAENGVRWPVASVSGKIMK